MDSDPTPEALTRAAQHLREGEFDEASRLLATFLQENPTSADAWVLFSYALADPVRMLECVERALQLDPQHAHAGRRMQELRERHPEVQTSWARPQVEPTAGEPRPVGISEPPAEAGAPAPAEEPEPPAEADAPAPAEEPEPPAEADAPAPAEEPEPPAEAPAPAQTAEPEEGSAFAEQGEPPATPSAPPFTVPLEDVGSAASVDAPMQISFLDGDQAADEPQAIAATEPASAEEARGGRATRGSRLALALGLLFGCALVAGGAGLAYTLLVAPPAQPAVNPTAPVVAGATSELTPVVLPPSWTPTFTPTITPTRTPAPTRTPTATPTFAPPNPTQLASLANLQVEVADLRGLGLQGSVEPYLISRLKARIVLEDMYRSAGGSEEMLADQQRELVALGLVKPTYNMIDTVLNGLADAVGGFFDPVTKRLFVIGGGLGALERFVFSHEIAHALVDQHYPFDQLGAYPICQGDADHCRAISGLVEGDATLVMSQWLQQFASPQDYLELLDYRPPPQALPEQFPPPYAVKDGEFAYQHGTNFVQFLHERGNWAQVNRAYANLPQSSEQILHPQKYLSREQPQQIHPPSLEGPLGEGWRQVASDTLGEWGTYLLLGYGADLDAQLLDGLALYAAQGWGGDRYQVYYHEASGGTLLAAHWRWDNDPEAEEFHRALQDHLDHRFRGQTLDRGTGACWQGPEQVSCIYLRGAGVLWILAPDQAILEAALGAYAGFP